MPLPLLMPDWPGVPENVTALSTLRSGGVSLDPYGCAAGRDGGLNLGVHVGDQPGHVRQNRARLQALLPSQPAWLTQVHGTDVLDAAAMAAQAAQEREAPRADASFAAAPDTVCLVMTADCLPVLFADAEGRVVAAAHAGWRGLAAGVLGRTVAAMRAAGADDILAWLGPAIGPRQFEVGADVLDTFRQGAAGAAEAEQVAAAFAPIAGRPGKYLADIYALARMMLRRDGVERVSGGAWCTVSDAARFYSFRRDGVTGRQASLIWRK